MDPEASFFNFKEESVLDLRLSIEFNLLFLLEVDFQPRDSSPDEKVLNPLYPSRADSLTQGGDFLPG
ncbi:MAG: hypothetical protein WAO20_03825, partial [Acidobacteriota bacterium]